MNTTQPAAVHDMREFEIRLREACGHFALLDARNKRKFEGTVIVETRLGIRFMTFSTNLQQLSRSRREIKLDGDENFFLVTQEDGNALVSQHEASHWLQAGDMVLIDSTEPFELTFFGEFNRLRFVLLPRAEVLGKISRQGVIGGNFIPRLDPINVAISAVQQKIYMSQALEEPVAGLLRQALLILLDVVVWQAGNREQPYGSPAKSGMDHALRISREYMDSRYRDPRFTIKEMADTLRLSMRQIQRGFALLGTTPTRYLLIKRLEHARKEIDHIIAGRRTDLISTIAFEAGFSDLSYFQRTFRRAFGNTPRDYISGTAENDSE